MLEKQKNSDLTEQQALDKCITEERNITTKIRGLQNVMNEVKQDIEYFLNYPYVVKVEVLKIMVNSLGDMTPKTYRWKGAKKPFEDGSFDYYTSDIIFDKAWQKQFEYKAYNLDSNVASM